jgi:hypothetical protein
MVMKTMPKQTPSSTAYSSYTSPDRIASEAVKQTDAQAPPPHNRGLTRGAFLSQQHKHKNTHTPHARKIQMAPFPSGSH